MNISGSTFPKAKPKQSLLTVIRLAVVRYLLLPLYAKWWVAQTSSRIFAFLLFLYVMQMLNWAIYSYNVNKPQINANDSDTCSANAPNDDKSSTNDFISVTDLVVPMSLSLLLSLIHSQIVATSASSNLTAADKRSKGPIQQHRKKRERKKRRKSTRSRSSLNVLASDASKSRANSLTEEKDAIEQINVQMIRRLSGQPVNEASDSNCSPPRLRKRNVNWRSPIKSNYSLSDDRRNEPSTPEQDDDDDDELAHIRDIHLPANTNQTNGPADDDGFESLNGKSSSGEEMSALNNVQAIDLMAENETTQRNNQQQYANSAYLMGAFDDNDDNDVNNNSDNDRINGTDGITENVCTFYSFFFFLDFNK